MLQNNLMLYCEITNNTLCYRKTLVLFLFVAVQTAHPYKYAGENVELQGLNIFKVYSSFYKIHNKIPICKPVWSPTMVFHE